MICPVCGNENQNNGRFCAKCGYEMMPEVQQGAVKEKKKKGISKGIIGAGALIACLMIIIIGLVVFFVTRKETIDLNEYLTVEFSGVDGYGSAEIEFDYDQFELDTLDAAGMTDIAYKYASYDEEDLQLLLSSKEYEKMVYYVYAIEAFDYEIDESDELSNGDTVTVTFTYNNDIASKAGFKFKGTDIEITVSGLDEVAAFDPFEDISVEFTGVSPCLEASILNESANTEIFDHINFSLSKTTDIALGETITVTAELDIDEEKLASNYGVVLSSTSKEYVCDNGGYYAADISDISDDVIAEMKSDMEEVLDEYFDTDKRSAENISYEGYYFLSLKDQSDDTDIHNCVVMIYSADVTTSKMDSAKLYFRIIYNNVITNSSTGKSTVTKGTSTSSLHDSNDLYIKYVIFGFSSISDIEDALKSEFEGLYDMDSVDLD